MKLARLFYSVSPEKWLDLPIAEGNTFANLMLQIRNQGFALDPSLNAYVKAESIVAAFQLEMDALPVAGMTKQ